MTYIISNIRVVCYSAHDNIVHSLHCHCSQKIRYTQLHCASWDNYSGRYAHSYSDSPSAPHSWSPDSVMEDFEKDGFLKMLDELNQTLGLVSLSA